MCTLLVEKGTFTKTTNTSVPASQQVNLSNGSLNPKFIILWTTGDTAFNTYTDDSRFSYGFSDGTNHACQTYRMDESAESESYAFYNNKCISIINLTTNAVIAEAHVSATAAGSFTLSWTTQSDATAMHIHYIVADGTDITNCQVVNGTVQNTSTGSHSWNGSGTSFTPKFALTMTGADSLTTLNTLQVGADRATISVGAVDAAGHQWVCSGRDETVTTADCDMYFDNAACLANHDPANGAIDYLANFVSFNNSAGGGITLNVSNAATNSAQPVAFLFVNFGDEAAAEVGDFQQRNGAGTQDVTFVNTFLDPSLVFLAGINSATEGSLVANFYLGFGASDGSNEGCAYFGNQNGATTFVSSSVMSNTKVYRIATPAATASSSTTNAECNINDMATRGKFQLNWTTANSTLRRLGWWTIGVVPLLVSQTSIQKYNLNAYVSATSIQKYHLIPQPALVKFGTITLDATSGAHTQTTYANELGWRPQGMIIWGTGQTADGTVADANMGIGMTKDNATGDWGYFGSQGDAGATITDTGTESNSNDCIMITDTWATSRLVQGSLNFQDNGFDIVYTTKTNTTQYKLNYFAFRSPHIEQIYCGFQAIPASTGNWNITNVGFQGSIAFFGGGGIGVNASTGGMPVPSIGVAMNSSKQWAVCTAADNSIPSNNARRQRTDRCLQAINTVTGFPNNAAEISFTNWLSNGLSLNVIATDNDDMQLMVIKGGDWDIGTFDQPTSQGDQIVETTNPSLNVKGALFCSFNAAATTNAVDHHRFTLGGGDGTNECCSWIGATDNVSTSIARRDQSTTKCIRMLEEVTGSANLVAEADLSDVSTAGEYTLNWPNVDATARQVCWLVLGDLVIPEETEPVSQTSIHKYDIRKNVAQTSIQKYHLFQNILQTTIQKYHILNNIIQSSIQKYSILNNVLQTSIQKYHSFQNIVQSSLQKYNIIQYALQNTIQKYDILNFVTATSTHKYNSWQNVIQTTIQKYHVLQNIISNSIQKYDLLQNIISNSIQKYHLLQNILSNSIQKYNILNNVIQSSIQKYHTFQNVIESLIGKYHILNFTEIAESIHKYDIIQVLQVLAENIHKYNLLQYATSTSIQKYHLFQNALQISIQKYHIFQNIIQSSVQKYDILNLIAQTSIHKYHSFQDIIQSSIHKYHSFQNALQTSIQKYDTFNDVIQLSIQKYNIIQSIIQNSIQKYDLLNNVLQSSIQKYHLFQNILAESLHKYHLFQNIISSSIQKYDILVQNIVLATNIAKYHIYEFVTNASVQKYHILNWIVQSSIHKYHSFQNAIQNSIQKYDILQEIVETSIQKYDMLENVISNSLHKYDLIQYIISNSIHKYHSFQEIISATIQKYDILNTVVQESIHKYSTLQNILNASIQKYHLLNFTEIANSIQKYDTFQNVIQASIQKYHLFQNIISSSIQKYEILMENVVIASNIAKYHIYQFVTETNIQKYHILNTIAQMSIQKYDMLQNVIEDSIHKYHSFAMALSASIQKYDILEYITNSTIQKYHILNSIIQNSIQKYDTLQNVLSESIQKYDTIQQIINSSIQKYHMLNDVLQSSIQKYNLFQLVSQMSIHKYDILTVLQVLSQSIQKYDILAYVTSTSKHKYNIGVLYKKLVSVFGAGKDVELKSAAKILQDFIKSRWP
jgi:hypothetical protein